LHKYVKKEVEHTQFDFNCPYDTCTNHWKKNPDVKAGQYYFDTRKPEMLEIEESVDTTAPLKIDVSPISKKVEVGNVSKISFEVEDRKIEQQVMIYCNYPIVQDNNWKGLYPTKYTLNVRDMSMFQKSMPGVQWIHEPKASNHKHVYGQKLRDIGESMMWNYIIEEHEDKFIRIGLGDNLKRNRAKKIYGHSINAVLDEEDEKRQNKYIKKLNPAEGFSYCHCRANSEKCSSDFCMCALAHIEKYSQDKTVKKDIIITAVDSMYYDGVFEFSTNMLKTGQVKRVYFTGGVFRETNSTEVREIMNGEAKYSTNIAGGFESVIMTVKGNYSGYVHQHLKYGTGSDMYIKKQNVKSSRLVEQVRPDWYMVTRLLEEIDVDVNYSYCIFERYMTKWKPSPVGFYDMPLHNEQLTQEKLSKTEIRTTSTIDLKIEKDKTLLDKWLELCCEPTHNLINLLETERGNIFTYSGSLFVASRLSVTSDAYQLVKTSYKVHNDSNIITKMFSQLPRELTPNTIISYQNSLVRDFGMELREALILTHVMFEIGALHRISVQTVYDNPIVRKAWLGESTITQSISDTSAKLQNVFETENVITKIYRETGKKTEFIEKLADTINEIPDTLSRLHNAQNGVINAVLDAGIRIKDKFSDISIDDIYDRYIRNNFFYTAKIRTNLNSLSTWLFGIIMVVMVVTPVGAKQIGPLMLSTDSILSDDNPTFNIVNLDYYFIFRICLMLYTFLKFYKENAKINKQGKQKFKPGLIKSGKFLVYVILREIISSLLAYTIKLYTHGYHIELLLITILALYSKSKTLLMMVCFKYTFCMQAGEVIIGTCTPNKVEDMITEMVSRKLLAFWDRGNVKEAMIKTSKTEEELCKCDRNSATHIMKQKGPLFYGTEVQPKPYFLHSCIRNATESVYRQFSSQVVPDQRVIIEFGAWYRNTYGADLIQNLMYADLDKHSLNFTKWMSRYSGNKLKKYQQAYDDYLSNYCYKGKCVDATAMEMHSKTDEKVFVDYNSDKPKIKARTVTEQSNVCKVLMGPLINFISGILKETDQAFGSGLNMKQRCVKFERWLKKYPDHIIVCIDGSAFDATQYTEIMEQTDAWLYNKVIDIYHDQIDRYASVADVRLVAGEFKQKVKNTFF